VAALRGKQKTRPAALNKSGRLIAPGFLTNAAANVAMALTVFIASSTPRSTNPQVKETLMAEPLSPAALAVMTAGTMGNSNVINDPVYRQCIAAALQAAADQVVPDESHPEESQFWDDEAEQEWQNNRHVRAKLRAIAAELEGGND